MYIYIYIYQAGQLHLAPPTGAEDAITPGLR